MNKAHLLVLISIGIAINFAVTSSAVYSAEKVVVIPLGGSSGGVALDQSCQVGEVMTGINLDGTIACSKMAQTNEVFSLLAETMQPIDSTIAYDNNAGLLKTTTDSSLHSTQYIGQVTLPHNSRITSVVGYGRDSDPNNEFQFSLIKYNLVDLPENVFTFITNTETSGVSYQGGSITLSATLIEPIEIVDNVNYSYGMYVVLPKATQGELVILRFAIETTN